MFPRSAARFEPFAYAALRIVSGSLFACHGLQKIFGWLGSKELPAVGSQMWVGGLIELVGGVLLAVGLFTRCAAFVCSGTMAVAYFQFHFRLAGSQWLPIVNKGELAVLFCFTFLFIFAHGPGAASLDKLRARRT